MQMIMLIFLLRKNIEYQSRAGSVKSYAQIWVVSRVMRVVSRVMRKFDLALAEIYFRGRVHAPWLPSSGQGAKGQGRRYAARLALDPL